MKEKYNQGTGTVIRKIKNSLSENRVISTRASNFEQLSKELSNE